VKDKCSFSFPPYGLNPKLSVANYFHPSITNHHKQSTTFSHQLIEVHFGRGVTSNKFCRKNAINHEKGDPLDFMTPQVIPSKKFVQSPKNTPLEFQLCISWIESIICLTTFKATIKRKIILRQIIAVNNILTFPGSPFVKR
jgi:hypothetical protein